MEQGWRIFVHSVRQVFGNLSAALRISGVLFIAMIAIGLALGSGPMVGSDPSGMPDAGAAAGGFLAALCALVLSLWIAVAWHRYVLRLEGVGQVVPPFRGQAILRYLGYSLLVALMLFPLAILAVLIVGGLVGGIMFAPDAPDGGLGSVLVVGLLVYIPILMLFYRLSPLLPAAAVGEPLTLRAAWAATRGASGAMLVLAALSAAGGIAVGILSAGLPGVLGLVIGIAGQWVLTMIGVSILTTIYGHYVEKRQLVA